MANAKKKNPENEVDERIGELEAALKEGTRALESAREDLTDAKENFQKIAKAVDEIGAELEKLKPKARNTVLTDYLAARRKIHAEEHAKATGKTAVEPAEEG